MQTAVQTFPIKKASPIAVGFCLVILLIPVGDFFILKHYVPKILSVHMAICVGLAALMLGLAYSVRNTRFEVSQSGLRIRGDMWGRTFRWSELDAANARVVNFQAEPGMKLRWRTCGTGLPGYAAGWFRLVNKTKALVFVTDKTEAIVVPTRKGFNVMMTAQDNVALLRAIQQLGNF